MALFLVTYDISCAVEGDRTLLRAELERGAWAQVAESSYVIQRQNCTAQSLYQSFSKILTAPAVSLYIFQLAEDFYGSGLDLKVQKWIDNARKNYPHGV